MTFFQVDQTMSIQEQITPDLIIPLGVYVYYATMHNAYVMHMILILFPMRTDFHDHY